MSDSTEVKLSSPAPFKLQLLILHGGIKNVGYSSYRSIVIVK
jgi:hypothetical protein